MESKASIEGADLMVKGGKMFIYMHVGGGGEAVATGGFITGIPVS